MANKIRVLSILCILFGAGAIAASAQINPGATVSVPFSFTVGNKTYDAGQYNVKIARSGLSSASLTIQREGAKEFQTVLLREQSGETAREFQLVFGGEDNKFLSEIATSSGSYLLVGAPQSSAVTLTSATKRTSKSKM